MAEVKQPGDSERRSVSTRRRFTAFTGVKISLVVLAVSYFLINFFEGDWAVYLGAVISIASFSFPIFGFFALLKLHARNEERTPIGKVLTEYALYSQGDDLLLVQKRVGDWYFFFYTGIFGVLLATSMFFGSLSFLLQAIRTPELGSISGFLGFGIVCMALSLTLVPLFVRRFFFLPWKRKILILNRDSVWVKYGKKSDIPDRIEALKANPDDAELDVILDKEVLQMLKRFEDLTDRKAVLEEIRMESQRVWDDASDDADRARQARLARQKEEQEFLAEVEDARVCLRTLRRGGDPNAVGSSGSDEKEEIPRPTRRGFKPTTIAGILFAVFAVSVTLGALRVEWMVSRWKGFAFWSFLFFAFQMYEVVRERRGRMRENLSLLDLILEDYTLSTQADRVILVRKYLRGLGFTVVWMFPLGLFCLGFGSLLGFMTWLIFGTLNAVTAGTFPILVLMWLMWGKVCKGLLFPTFDLPFRRRILILSRDALCVKKGDVSNLPVCLEEIEAQPEFVLPDRPAPWDRNLRILQKLCEDPQDRQTILEELRRRSQG